MGLPTCLISRHQHIAALSAMGVAPESPTFPAVVTCPLCQHPTLYLFDDAVTAGIWLHCKQCLAYGDIITFAGKIWNTSPAETAENLIAQGLINREKFDGAFGDYEQTIKAMAAADDLWHAAAEQIWDHGDDLMAVKLRSLGARQELDTTGYVGVATAKQIFSLCRTINEMRPKQLRADGTFLVMPHYDLPGRICGFLITQYDVNDAERAQFLSIPITKSRRPDAGYFLLPAATERQDEVLKNTIFIVSDPYWALKTQFKQLRQYKPPLPIVASYRGTNATSCGANWVNIAPSAVRLFQDYTISPDLISQACWGRGYVALSDSPVGKKSLAYLVHVRHRAQTWQTALYKTLQDASEAAAYSFISRLRIPPEKLQLFFRRHQTNFAPAFIARALSATRNPTSIKLNKRNVVIERDNEWVTNSGNQVCAAKIVIEKVYYVDTDEKMYVGTIYAGDDKIQFADNAERIERLGLLRYAAAVLAPTGKLLFFDRLWNARAHLIAMQLNPPEIVNISSLAGWDEKAEVFRLGRYHLTATGVVEPTPALPQQKTRIVFPEPEITAPITLRPLLAATPENAFVWSVFASVAANLIAPVVNADNFATAVPGTRFNTAVKIATALQCEFRRHTGLYASKAVKLFEVNDWPVCIANAFDDSAFSHTMPKYHNRALLVRLSNAAASIAPGYGWLTISGTAPPPATDVSALKHILPNYLQRTLKNRMTIAAHANNLFNAVLADVQMWLTDTYGSSFSFEYARQNLFGADTAHVALMLELRAAVAAGKIAVLPRPRRKDQPSNYVLRWRENYWLNKRAIDRYFSDSKVSPPNWIKITELLSSVGVFAGEERIHSMLGVLVSTSWADQYLLMPDTEQRTATG